ncbi:MAG: hypothetical protein ACI9J0_003913 [Cryomorphaceae bacterium]|jgi:hypothetical protein
MNKAKHSVKRIASVVLTCAASAATLAQEPIVTLRSTVTGNQEQPRVMYIVPWQQPGGSNFEYVMESSIGDELFAPVDREEFVRSMGYEEKIGTRASTAAMEE